MLLRFMSLVGAGCSASSGCFFCLCVCVFFCFRLPCAVEWVSLKKGPPVEWVSLLQAWDLFNTLGFRGFLASEETQIYKTKRRAHIYCLTAADVEPTV